MMMDRWTLRLRVGRLWCPVLWMLFCSFMAGVDLLGGHWLLLGSWVLDIVLWGWLLQCRFAQAVVVIESPDGGEENGSQGVFEAGE